MHSVHRFPGVFLTIGESIQLKILFYRRIRNLTADRFLTFRESDWRFLSAIWSTNLCDKKAKALSASAKFSIRLLYHKKEIESEQG